MKRCLRTPSSKWDRTISLSLLPDLAMWRGLNRLRLHTLTLIMVILCLGSIGLSTEHSNRNACCLTRAPARDGR